MRAVNLIPAEQRSGARMGGGRSGGGAYVVLATIAGLAILAVLYGVAHSSIGSREAEASRLSAEASQAEAAASRLAPYTRFLSVREERLKDVEQLAGTRFDWAHAMHELGRVLPSQVQLTSVTGTIGAAAATPTTSSTSSGSSGSGSSSSGSSAASAVTSATPPGSVPQLSLAGCATGQDEVALTMDRLRLMNGVSEVTLQSSSKGGSSSGSSGSSGAGACPDTFSMQVSYVGLPTPAAPTSPPPATTRTTSAGGTP